MDGEEVVLGGAGGGAAVAEEPGGGAAPDEGAQPGGTESSGAPEVPGAEPGAGTPDADAAKAAEDALGDIETDGRKLEGKVRAAVAKLAGMDKAAAKEVRDAYFGRQAVMKEFPEAKNLGEAISQIRSAKATIESLGGDAGIKELQTEVEDYRREVQQFADGDRGLIEQLAENPQALARAGRNALSVLREKSVKDWETALTPSLAEYLHDPKGLATAVDDLIALVQEGKGQEAFDKLHHVKAWLGGIRTKAEEISKDAGPRRDPEREQLEKDREDFQKEKEAAFKTAVETDVNKLNNAAISRHVDPMVKELKLTNEGRSHFVNGLASRIWNVLAKDETYLKQVRAIRAKGDVGKTAAFIAEAFAERLPEQFRLHRNEVYPNIGGKKALPPMPPANGGKKVAPIAIAAGARPRREDVDWAKTTDAMWITGRAYLKDGKLVTGFKDAPANRL